MHMIFVPTLITRISVCQSHTNEQWHSWSSYKFTPLSHFSSTEKQISLISQAQKKQIATLSLSLSPISQARKNQVHPSLFLSLSFSHISQTHIEKPTLFISASKQIPIFSLPFQELGHSLFIMSETRATRRTSRGRQKVDMVKMKNENNLQVTFSKRRSGLFKKASELCTLTGSEIAVVVFSPGEKAYSFGSPSVNEIVERFESQTPHLVNTSTVVVDAHRRASVTNLNKELGQIESELEKEKKRSEELNQMARANSRLCWWAGPFDELRMEQLDQLRLALEDLHRNVKLQAQKLQPETPHLYATPPARNVYGVTAAASASFNIFRPSATSAFFPYDPRPSATMPSIPFSPYVGPTLFNNTISVKNGPAFELGDNNGAGPSAPFCPTASGFGGGAAPPYPYEFFNNRGYGNGGGSC